MKKLFLSILFITTSAYAQMIDTYCFNTPAESVQAQNSIRNLLLAGDTIDSQDECFMLTIAESRRELIMKYLRNSQPSMKLGSPVLQNRAVEMCSLKVEKVKTYNAVQTQAQAQINSIPTATIGNTSSKSTETSQIKTLANTPFDMQIDQNKIQGKCKFRSSTRYEIEFSMIFVPKPIIQGVVTPPEPQQGTSLSTVVLLNQGEKLEIGGVVKDLTEKASKADLLPQFSYDETQGQSQEKIYLTID